MKNYTLILCMFLLSGCLNNDFMERYPLGNPTAETAFVSYDNFKPGNVCFLRCSSNNSSTYSFLLFFLIF